ncbi:MULTISPECIES: FG-GAP-like repeat-containing protein [unclassified Corallococcus]|uniref:FG-GAP-like repeat-containing protein n=1 Tax=unclassified Corallococcus TaxID=2685029 RepID=UPI001A8D5112|nr:MULTISPECIES: FG-GAP-like repeat-containing protein [unclassified Corallococcus]MBN9688407.1 VCBS repeat-containing protein [Corallococcus sp. NCSPR001]WAS87793.1 FG-GAP-like repeat-containing protein [Corallococcus sp. NCRR]
MSHRHFKRLLLSRPFHQALLSLGLLGFCVPALAADTGSVSFKAVGDFKTGEGPRHLAITDLDKDGTPDILTANTKDRSLSILMNGASSEAVTVPLRAALGAPTGIAAGTDFDLDGHADIAVVGKGALAIYPGDGKGGVKADAPLVNLFNPNTNLRELVIVELDEQYTPDLASLGHRGGDGVMTVLPLENGETRMLIPTGGSPVGLAGREITGDGHDDIVTVDEDGTVTLLSGKGNGSYYTPFKKYPTHAAARRVALGDVTGDGKADAVVAGRNFVSVLKGDGNGNFEGAKNFTTSVDAKSLALADFDGDGLLDVVVAPDSAMAAAVFVNKGDGSFGEAVLLDTQGTISALAAADLDGDGKADLVVAREAANLVTVFHNTTDASEPEPEADASVQLVSRRVLTLINPYMLYEVRVTNNGPAKLESVTATAALPSGLSATAGDCTKGSGDITCAFSDIAPGETRSRFFHVPLRQYSSNKYYTVTASLSESTPEDPNPLNDEASRRCIFYLGQLVHYCD